MTDVSQPPKDPWTDKPKTPLKRQTSKKATQSLERWWSSTVGRTKFKRASNKLSPVQIGLSIILNTFLVWVALGCFTLAPGEHAVVTRFGKYHKTLTSPGFHWHRYLADRVIKLNIQATTRYLPSIEVITQEGYLILAKVELKYNLSNPYQYLFLNKTPLETLHSLALKVLRETLSHYTTQDFLHDPEPIQTQAQTKLQSLLQEHPLGLTLLDLKIRSYTFSDAVQANIDAIKRTQADIRQLQQQAEQEASLSKQKAALQAEMLLAEATIYKQDTISEASKNYDRFLKLLPYYKKSPKPTLQKLYLDALGAILKYHPKILILGENTTVLEKKINPQLGMSLEALLKFYSHSDRSDAILSPPQEKKKEKIVQLEDSTSLVDHYMNAPVSLGGYD